MLLFQERKPFPMNFLWFLLIGLAAGWLARSQRAAALASSAI